MSSTKAPFDEALRSVAEVLSVAPAVTVLCHTRPDADTIGSGLAIAEALRRLGTAVELSFAGPTELPTALAQLPGADLILDSKDVVGHPVVVAVDCASIYRLEALSALVESATHSIVIDHHISNEGFGTINYVDPQADCTAELVLSIIDELGVTVDLDMATCIYAGVVTDTGSFKWGRPKSHLIAARMLDVGVDGRRWTRTLLDTHRFAWLAMVSAALDSAVLIESAFDGRGLVYAIVDHDSAAALSWEESESVVDIVRTTAEAEVAVVFKEGSPGQWTVSMRAKSEVDLVPIAVAHGGGGHQLAAGFGASGTAAEVVRHFLASV
ncbi:bifunctional oligoribonuclease/PAP phosphatase NrnA [Nocardia sp. 348MFTsu5.1]|uniref:DHH family phosphoesterase n=1 Tax=Nocardia sp. 348MFTsu5.1 TaxID=1172185 RepID=UPI000366C721|nr:bifunctional oligoribonuclease/PAP phosphatase NrnA [Nocardia sp. 348MFTsu5.1]